MCSIYERIAAFKSKPTGGPMLNSTENARRGFLKELAALGAWPLLARNVWGRSGVWAEDTPTPTPRLDYQARSVSVSHFAELQDFIDGLRRDERISRNKTFRSYIDPRKFAVPADFSKATSVIVLAYRTPMLRFNVRHGGKLHELVISPQYFEDGITRAQIEAAVRRDIVKDPAARLEVARGLHLKLLAVRSGLGRYGRNNLCYVEGMGTSLALFAFLTDATGLEDSWHDLAMLDACRECPICYSVCPTNAIRKDDFVIDAGRCITLYNEVPGDFPNWILPGMHNALMGCMKCQLACPVNEKAVYSVDQGGEIVEEETLRILEGKPDDRLLESLGRKLKGFPPAADREQFPILTRNLRALLHA
jgi:epoxyqueuosine reductase